MSQGVLKIFPFGIVCACKISAQFLAGTSMSGASRLAGAPFALIILFSNKAHNDIIQVLFVPENLYTYILCRVFSIVYRGNNHHWL